MKQEVLRLQLEQLTGVGKMNFVIVESREQRWQQSPKRDPKVRGVILVALVQIDVTKKMPRGTRGTELELLVAGGRSALEDPLGLNARLNHVLESLVQVIPVVDQVIEEIQLVVEAVQHQDRVLALDKDTHQGTASHPDVSNVQETLHRENTLHGVAQTWKGILLLLWDLTQGAARKHKHL